MESCNVEIKKIVFYVIRYIQICIIMKIIVYILLAVINVRK